MLCQYFRLDYEKFESYLIYLTDQSVIFMQNGLISAIENMYKIRENNHRGVEDEMNKKEQEQRPRFPFHFKGYEDKRIVDTNTTLVNSDASDPTMHKGNYHLCMHYFQEKRGRCEISIYQKAADEIPALQSKRRRLQQGQGRTSTPTNHNIDKNKVTISPEDRIKINTAYITWLYAKSRERKKQNNGLLDTRRAIELVIRETGGEKALKELFLKEQEGKIINELSRSNPKIAEAFKQDRETGLNALNEFIVNLESND